MGFEIDVMPEGNMLLIENIDIPGVIGKVGKILGDSNIYYCSRARLQNDYY